MACTAAGWPQDTRTLREPAMPPACAVLTARLAGMGGGAGLPPDSESQPDTARIQAALNACGSGQGVELAAGAGTDAFLTGPIQIPKGVALMVDAGVTLFASRNPRDYDADSSKSCGTLTAAGGGCVPLLTVNGADGAGIAGYGAIDGRGYAPMLLNGSAGMTWWDLARSAASPLIQNNPRLLQVSNTNGFTLYKITLRNSPNFHVALGRDSNVTVWGVKIIAPYDARNTDGIDPGYSSNVAIVNSWISDGDDNVAIGASNTPGATNITVLNDWFGHGHGASIGSYTQNGVSNTLFGHITIAGESANRNQIGLRIKTDVSRGGLVRNIVYSNICMRQVRTAITLNPFYTAGATGTLIPQFRNITMQDIHATTEGLVQIQGHDASAPATVTLDNVQVDGVQKADVTAQYAAIATGPRPVNLAPYLSGTGVSVTGAATLAASPYACPDAAFSPVMGELAPGPAQVASGAAVQMAVQVLTTKEIPFASYSSLLAGNPMATLELTPPAGTVTVYDGTRAVGSAAVNGTAWSRITVAGLGDGPHHLYAVYSGDANYAGRQFGGYDVTVGSPAAGQPAISAGGVTNAASFAPATAPYGVARGSYFSIFGTNVGPVAPVAAAAYPLAAVLGGVAVKVWSGGQEYDAFPTYASAGQVNAILPSAVPAGPALVTLTNNGTASQTVVVDVVETAPGIFFARDTAGVDRAVAQNVNSATDYALNVPAIPAKPGQIVILWATGMGALSGAADNVSPGGAAGDLTATPVTILVGGVPAKRVYAGRQSQFAGIDAVMFTVPDGAPSGCAVPVQITGGGVPANTTRIAVTADGSPCQ
ncbi:MAG: Ig-like domain repeat protein [Acidobacteria bacterium]|nr:Ig-like domain repeat protein [Acidobacteriota bacterium]